MVAHVREAATQLVLQAVNPGRRDMFHTQRHQRVDHHQERERVQHEARAHPLLIAEAPFGKCRDGRAECERAKHARDVELDRVERDGVGQILLVDERRDERLIRGAAERLGETGRERQDEDVPDLHDAEEHEEGQRGRRHHLDVLRRHQRLSSIAAVGQHAADEHEEHERQALEESVEAEEKGRSGQRLNHPVLRRHLRPRADARCAGAKPLDAKIAVSEGGERPTKRFRAEQGDGSDHRVGGGGDLRWSGFGQEVLIVIGPRSL